MSAWIVTIAAKYPDHLDFALEDGFWDTRRRAQIRSGDEVFFWVSGAGLSAWVEVTEGLRELRPLDTRARWHDRSSGRYAFRFGLRSRAKHAVQRRWGQIKADTGITQLLSNGIIEVPEAAIPIMRGYFGADPDAPVRADVTFPGYELGMDLRDRAMKEIVIRRGQSEFRDALIDAYQQCSVTGCEVMAVLEAAHIDRYFGGHSHHVTNGLLLRSDVHTLFDARLVAVDDDYRITTSPRLSGSSTPPTTVRRYDCRETRSFGPIGMHLRGTDWTAGGSVPDPVPVPAFIQ